MGDKLIVSLTNDHMVNKGPGRPVNTWIYRAALLGELRCVDEVIGTDSAVDAILHVKPDIFCKGIDYVSGDMFTEAVYDACQNVGAVICYTTAPKMSATDIIRKAMQ
jgi:bifunctional ADP-heptose synthase (sugar kinase/adenylyltransferase)